MFKEKIKRLKEGEFTLEANTGNPIIMVKVLFILSLVSALNKEYKDAAILFFAFVVMILMMPFVLIVYAIFLPFKR